jgi:hypothetical protein
VGDAVEEFWNCKKDGFCTNVGEGKVCTSHRGVEEEGGGLRLKVVVIWQLEATNGKFFIVSDSAMVIHND